MIDICILNILKNLGSQYELDEKGLSLMKEAFFQDVFCNKAPYFIEFKNVLYDESKDRQVMIGKKKEGL